MDQQNYELDQTGAEETPKKKKGSTVKGIVSGARRRYGQQDQ